MSKINVNKKVNVRIEMSEEEIETVKKAYDILYNISNSLYEDGAEETDAYTSSSLACEWLCSFMKYEIGIDIERDDLTNLTKWRVKNEE